MAAKRNKMDEKTIIQKLAKVLANQQKILVRLAQATEDQSQYLRNAAQVAAVNTGFQATHVDVVRKEGHTGSPAGGTEVVKVEPGYIVTVGGVPKDNAVRQKYINTFKTQVQTQKPGLEANLSILLED